MSQQASIRLREAEAPVALNDAPEAPRLAIAAQVAAPLLDAAQLTIITRAALARQSREALYRRMLALADVLAMTATLVVVLTRFGIGWKALAVLASIPVVVVLFKIAGLYNRDELRLGHSTLDEVPLLVQLTGLFALGAAILYPALSTYRFTRWQVAILWLAGFAAVLTGRVLVRSVARRVTPVERGLIIGEVQRADRIRRRIAASRARTVVIDCLSGADIRSHGGLPAILGDLRIDRIIIAPITEGPDESAELIRVAKALGVRVSVLPSVLEVVGSSVAFDEVEGMAMLGLPRFGLCRSSRQLKRLFDLAATTVGLVFVGPLLMAIALVVRLDSKGPIFFRQTRIGRDGKPFRIVKFRSMVADAEAQKDQLRAQNIAGQGLFKITNDPRVTRVGRLLRSTSLDELPQLFNVLSGDMSLVGPRPLVTDEDAQVLGLDRSRLMLKPGITGPWQLLGSRVPLQEMVEIDYLYVSNWSLWLDVKILLRTARHVVQRGNE
jgi:exopolysaccharide biosynthesis polyprenyl glycosylphosphotransferase